MHILCINYEFPPIGGGGGIACKGLARALVKMGYKIDIVTSGMRSLPAYEELEGLRIHRVRCIRRFKHYVTSPELLTQIIPAYFRALELIDKNSYDLNHTHFVVPSGLISYLLWKKTGLHYVITAHGSDIPGYNPDRFHFEHFLIRGLWKRIIRNSSTLISPSQFLKRLIQDNINVDVDVIPNGYEFSSHSNQVKKNQILVVTRMFKRKGIQYFIKAVADLKTDWEILIAGDGPYLATLKTAAKNLPKIKFLGFVQGEELNQLYQAAKIFVFPSLQENYPMVLLEAMDAGCAIITTTASGCIEVVGDAAIKTRPGNAQEIKKGLEYLINDEQELKRLAQLGKQRAENYTWPKIACYFDGLFRKIHEKESRRKN